MPSSELPCSSLHTALSPSAPRRSEALLGHCGVTAPFACLSDLSTLCRNVMSSQEVVDFVQSKITQKDENGVLRPLSSIVEEVRSRAPPSPSAPQPGAWLYPPSPSDWFVQPLGSLAAHGLQCWLEREQRRL